jgi:hypothetical protein
MSTSQVCLAMPLFTDYTAQVPLEESVRSTQLPATSCKYETSICVVNIGWQLVGCVHLTGHGVESRRKGVNEWNPLPLTLAYLCLTAYASINLHHFRRPAACLCRNI